MRYLFVNLHVHSAYSLLTSTVKIDELVSEAKDRGYSAIALTDRNVVYGILYFYKECMKHGIKPIIGVTADILDENDTPYPLILLARDNIGYRNLMKISSAIKTKSPSGLPMKWLKPYSEGLIAISPGYEGKIEKQLLEGDSVGAKKTAELFSRLFGEGHFYLSIQQLSMPKEEELLAQTLRLAQESSIKVIATNPVYYINKEDSLAQEVLLAVKNGEKLSDEERTRLPSHEFYLKSTKEMVQLFRNYPDALENTLDLANKCTVEIEFNRKLLPKFPVPDGITADEMLEKICQDGLKRRAPEDMPAYMERLHYELEIIKRMKFSHYFLIVWDFMRFARKKHILTGPGRGSSAGSMVAYVLEITNVDPLEHNLLFERFLNPERISMPDIDIDFPDNRREEVISYVASKYGEFHVAQIITFGTLAAKAAIRDTGRVFGLNPKEQESLSKMIPSRLGITLKTALDESRSLRAYIEESEWNKRLFETALKIEGLPRHTSTHAAGVVISDMQLTDIIAIQEGHEGVHLTQFPMDLLEELGLLKMDFLGLRNLTLLENIVSNIRRGANENINIASIPLDDEETYLLLSKGDTTGVFQFESDGIRKVLTRLQPSTFEDIVAVNALYRPGPMDNIPLFIERKHGLRQVEYPHPVLQDILGNTQGVIVYQEQIMQIASKMAGFTLGEADLLRRAVSKKKREILNQEREHFVNGCLEQGYEASTANEIYDLIVRFANYGFPRSHAVAYSMIAYQLAYLKEHYPQYFMAALLTSVIGNDDKIAQYVTEAKNKGITVLQPSINTSHYAFTAGNDGIRYSLGAIKGIGAAVLKEIFQARRNKKFEDLFDFCMRVSGKVVNRKILESLVHAGAFDEFGQDRAVLLASLDVAMNHAEFVNPEDDQFELFSNEEFSLKPKYVEVEKIRMEDKLYFEKSVLGLYLSNHPVKAYRDIFKHYGAATMDLSSTAESKVLAGVYIVSLKTIRTKKGEVMAFLTISDEGGDLEAIAFPNVYKMYSPLFNNGNILMIIGSIEERDGKKQIIIQEAYSLEELKKGMDSDTSCVFIRIKAEMQTNQVLNSVKKVLLQHRGRTKVMLYYEREARYVQLSFLDWVSPSEALFHKLKKIAGDQNVVFKKN
ncbi:DNA polymerase III subunit alpha [Peribacillus sp. SCS-155]|uniref:DNA polymerase III subunit alpha n=1 Tax=Peribacillus sedimenti TaxID=3115297 RepID=UPI003906764A